jgi:autotransporter translocation and assembly factor TamB
VLLGLVVLGAVFHRQLLRMTVAYVGAKVAQSQGLDVEWDITGSILGDLTVDSFKTKTEKEEHWLPKAELEKFALNYNLRELIRRDYEKAIESLTMHNGVAEVDLRYLPTADPTKSKPKKRDPSKPPALVWPETVDIANVDLTVTLKSGKRLVLRGLTFKVGKDMPGVFSAREIRLEPDGLALGPLKADVAWESRLATFKNMVLPQNVVVEKLVADLKGWDLGALTAAVNARFGGARADIELAASGLRGNAQEVRAQAQVRQLGSAELYAVGLPPKVAFEGAELDLSVAGNPKAAATMTGGLQLRAANVRAAGVMLDQVEANLEVENGNAVLRRARLVRTGNTIEASGEAALPADLANWRQTQWQAKANASLTNIADVIDRPPPLTGTFVVNASAEGVGTTPTKVAGEVQAQEPTFQSYKLPQLRTTFALDGRQARIEIPPLALGADNVVSLNATMQLDEAMPVSAQWDITISDPGALFAATGLPPPPQSVRGRVQTQGQGRFAIRDLRAQVLTGIEAEFTLAGSDVIYGEGRLQGLHLRANVSGGQALFQPLTVRVDEQNEVQVEGRVGLTAPHVFDAQGSVSLAELPALNGLLRTFKAPPIASGSVFGKVAGAGQLRPWQASGNLNVTATKVRAGKMEQAADAVVEGTFAGTSADLGKFEARLGPWRIAAVGRVDRVQADLAELKVWQEKTLLVQGRARVPYDILKSASGPPMDVAITAEDLRVDAILAAAGIKNIPAGVLSANIQLRGRGAGANGKAHVEMRDIKIPKRPAAFGDASAVLDLTLQGGRADLLLTAVQPPLQTITVTANVPVNLAELTAAPNKLRNIPLDARLEMPETDLGFLRQLAPDLIRSLPARGRVSASVRGTVADPVIQADIDISAPRIVWTKADLPSVRDLRVRIRADDDRLLRVEDASVVLAGGRVRIGGTINAATLTEPLLDLTVEAREALVYRNPTTSLRANASLTCRGPLASAHAAGTVGFVRGRLFKEIDFLPELSMPSDVPPLPPDTQRRNTQLVLPAFFKDWTFDIRAHTEHAFMIAGNVANGALKGNASLTGTGAAPVLTGTATVDRMLVRLPYSVIKVTQGDISLDPARPLDPALDIRGESRVGSTDVTIYVYGYSSDPKTRFTSIPPMSEADVVALLATGTSLNGSGNEVAADAAGRAIWLFVKEKFRKWRNKPKELDEEPPRLTVSISPSAAERTDDNLQVAYELNDKWRVTARFGQSGRVRGFLEYLLRFGEAARAVEDRKPNLARIAPNAER